MTQLPTKIKKRIDRFLPIETEGLTLYPITVEYWEEFRRCIPALEFMRQSLPVALLQIPLLDAFWQLEIANAASQDGGSGGAEPFSDICCVLCLADAKIGTVKILRPKTSRILSDFWCSEGGKASACRRQ